MNDVNIISTTISYKGYAIKISNGSVFVPQFGTTIYNHSPHWSTVKIPIEKLNHELKNFLINKELI